LHRSEKKLDLRGVARRNEAARGLVPAGGLTYISEPRKPRKFHQNGSALMEKSMDMKLTRTNSPFTSPIVSRRDIARGAVAAAALAAFRTPALAQQYPSQDVHFVCAFPAGSGADVIVRYMAEKMRPLMGRTIIVENKPGALGNISTEYLVRSKPDGHTILIHGASGVAAAASIIRSSSIDVGKSVQLVGTINRQPTMFGIHVSKPWKSVAEVTAAMKEKKEKGTYATTNPVGKVMGAIYKKTLGLQAVEVNYKTAADTLNDLANGSVDYILVDNVFAMSQVREKRLRVLAVSTAERLQANPDLPTMTESGIPMDLTGYFAAMVPTGTPQPIIQQLSKWVSEVVGSADTKKFLNSFASDPWVTTPEQGQAYFLKDIENWKNYVKIAEIEQQ
jgi:tripartite-type tricarboxylate transporter receptor subunit TctC